MSTFKVHSFCMFVRLAFEPIAFVSIKTRLFLPTFLENENYLQFSRGELIVR